VLEHIREAKKDGADIAIVAEPWFAGPASAENIENYYLKVLDKSPLPVGVYSRGAPFVPMALYRKILSHGRVCLLKDSSQSEELKKLALKAVKKKDLCLLTGYELGMPPYLSAGYHGVLAGGGALIGSLIVQMIEAVDDLERMKRLQKQCDRINYTAYGRDLKSWLTGLKYALKAMGIFKNTEGYLRFPLPEARKRKIERMIEGEREVLFPSD
jgi:dihydrodipicolinate synthase/N-acetylneuraminate lyase